MSRISDQNLGMVKQKIRIQRQDRLIKLYLLSLKIDNIEKSIGQLFMKMSICKQKIKLIKILINETSEILQIYYCSFIDKKDQDEYLECSNDCKKIFNDNFHQCQQILINTFSQMNNNECKKQVERLGTASTMDQTFQQSQFQQEYQKRVNFIQVNLFSKNIKNDLNQKQNTRYSRQEHSNESKNQCDELQQTQHNQQQYINQQQNSQSIQKQIQIKHQNQSQYLIEDRQEEYNSVFDNENLESPIPIQKKGKGEHLYVNCQMQALSEILVKYHIQELNQPFIKRKTLAKCCCFTITTKQSFYQIQKQIIITEGSKPYDENDINHCNLLYSILYQLFQLEKLTKKKSKEIEDKKTTVFQLIYILSCITLFKDDLLLFTKNDKDKIIGNLFIISKCIFEILLNGILDPIFKQSDSNGETLHNTLTSIHMGMFLTVCRDNLNQEQEIVQNLQNKNIKQLIDLWKQQKFQNN